MLDWELAWTAAFLESEGTLTINASPSSTKCRSVSPRFTVWVKADNTEPELVYRAQSFWGGAVRRYSSSKGKGYKPAYRWLITGPTAVACIKAVAPYFASKRKIRFTELLLELDQRLKDTPMGGVRLTKEEFAKRDTILAEVRRLNARRGRPRSWDKARKKKAQGDRLPLL